MKRSRPKPEVKALDALCRRLVFLRDRNTCQKSGKTVDLQWCHVYTRGIHSLRWEPDNSLVLTRGEHMKAHLHPLDFCRWFEEKFPERADRLRLLRQTKRKLDRAAMRLWLEQELTKGEG